jgi:hypothetical protein
MDRGGERVAQPGCGADEGVIGLHSHTSRVNRIPKSTRNKIMQTAMTLQDIVATFQSEWVLMEDLQMDATDQLTGGKVLFHSKDRDELTVRSSNSNRNGLQSTTPGKTPTTRQSSYETALTYRNEITPGVARGDLRFHDATHSCYCPVVFPGMSCSRSRMASLRYIKRPGLCTAALRALTASSSLPR